MELKHWGEIMGIPNKGKKKDRAAPRPSSYVTFESWSNVVTGKVVGVDISVLFHGLFGKKTNAVRHMLTVNPKTSVFYLVAQRMNEWFTARGLHEAEGVLFVHDPRLVDQFHCDGCFEAFKGDIKTKYDVSGRTQQSRKQAECVRRWTETVAGFKGIQHAEDRLAAGPQLHSVFLECLKRSNIVTQGLHDAFVAWVHWYNDQLHNARRIRVKQDEKLCQELHQFRYRLNGG